MEYSREYKLTAKKTDEKFEKVILQKSEDIYNYVRKLYFDDINIFESSLILMCNSKLQVKGWAKISQGGVASTLVDIKIFMKYAIDCLATNVVFVHNHPSGDVLPSKYDDNLTQRLKEACQIMDICLMDHLVVSDKEYYSYHDMGRL